MSDKSFIYIEFDQLGSTNYRMEAQGISSAQLFVISSILKWEANQAYAQEKMEATRQQIAKPTEGIIKP